MKSTYLKILATFALKLYEFEHFYAILSLRKGKMKEKKIVIFSNNTTPALAKTVVIKYSFPKIREFVKLFNSIGWKREEKRIKTNSKFTTFALSLYVDKEIVGMGRVVGDGAYYTIYDIVVDKKYQGLGMGSIIMREIVEWYKSIEDDDTFLYVNASKGKETFYQKFGFISRPNDDVGAGMKWYGENK